MFQMLSIAARRATRFVAFFRNFLVRSLVIITSILRLPAAILSFALPSASGWRALPLSFSGRH
jgi:hypothetical protein